MNENIYLNGEYPPPTDIVSLSDVPTILKVKQDEYGTHATISLTFIGDLSAITNTSGQWTITIMGNTIANTTTSDVANKSFRAMAQPAQTAASVARALRNCTTVYSTFNVFNSGATVTLTARRIGELDYNVVTNIDTTYLSVTDQNGSATATLNGKDISVDITSDGEYVTTLEKVFTDGECAFNLSPVLTTISKKFEAVPYELSINSYKDGEYNNIGYIGTNYTTVGYMVNQGDKYLTLPTGAALFAQNVSRGDQSGVDNAMPLYIYEPYLTVCFYAHMLAGMTITVDYLDSAKNVLSSTTTTWSNPYSSRKLKTYEMNFNSPLFSQAFYIDVTFGNTKIRYNVIKPLAMTEGCTRLYWLNEYGGISFFDFVGQRSETRNLTDMTYQKNIFDYYEDDKNELELSFENSVDYEVTIQSHLIPKHGTYIFNSLLQSPYIWTVVNGEENVVLLKNVNVDETEQNDIYRTSVTYRYSMKPSII